MPTYPLSPTEQPQRGRPQSREVDGNDTEISRHMQTDETFLVVDTSAGNTTAQLPNVMCVPNRPIAIRAQGANQVTVRPVSGQRLNGIVDGTVAVAANTTQTFHRTNAGWYS